MANKEYVEVGGWAEQQEHCAAAQQWLLRRTVGIAHGPEEPQQLGSGVVVDLGKDTFLATVAHNFRDSPYYDASEIRILPPNRSGITSLDSIQKRFPLNLHQVQLLPSPDELKHDGYLPPLKDLALLKLERSAAQAVGLIGVREKEIARDAVLGEDGLYAVAGVPFSLLSTQTDASPLLDYRGKLLTKKQVGLTFYTHFTVPHKAGAMQDGQYVVQYEDHELDPEAELVESPPPNGMSGGGLWEVVLRNSRESVKVGCQLVGLIRARLPGRLLVIPIEHWLRFAGDNRPESREKPPIVEQDV